MFFKPLSLIRRGEGVRFQVYAFNRKLPYLILIANDALRHFVNGNLFMPGI